jgi:hypothetical protein
MGILSLLQILFIGLKLTNHIDWSWFYVLLPFILLAIVTTVLATAITVLKLDNITKKIKSFRMNIRKKISKPSFLSLLQILFIGLKLTNHIDWSWFYVLLPLIIGAIKLIIILKCKIKD